MAYDTRAQALRKALLLIREAIIFVYVALGQYFLFFLFYFFFFVFPFLSVNYTRHVPDRCRQLAVSQGCTPGIRPVPVVGVSIAQEYCKERCTRTFCDWTISQGFALQYPLGCMLPVFDLRSTNSFGCSLSRIPK